MLSAFRVTVLATASLLAVLPGYAQEDFFGSGIPIEMAARKIVPSGVEVVIDSQVDGSSAASWGGDGDNSWKKAVASAAKSAGYVAIVTDEKVTIASSEQSVETKTVAAVTESSDESSLAVAAVERKVSAPERTAAPAPVVRPAPRQDRPTASRAPRPSAAPAARPAQRQAAERSAPRRSAERAPRPMTDTVSGGGFVFVPERPAPAAPTRQASVDAKGPASGWRSYEAPKEPRVRAVATPAAPVNPEWVVRGGEDLHTVLSGWSSTGGWRLIWESDYAYDLTSSAKFQGSFVDAVTQLLAAMRDVRPVVTAEFYEANKTLVIGNNLSDSVN